MSGFLCSDGGEGKGQLFRVQDANLRARVALQALECWPLSASLELLEFCLNDPSTETSLRTDLELKKKELEIYHWVILRAELTLLTFNLKRNIRTAAKWSREIDVSSLLTDVEFASPVALGYLAGAED